MESLGEDQMPRISNYDSDDWADRVHDRNRAAEIEAELERAAHGKGTQDTGKVLSEGQRMHTAQHCRADARQQALYRGSALRHLPTAE